MLSQKSTSKLHSSRVTQFGPDRGGLTRGGSGWSKDVLKAGDEVTITISPAKTGAPVGNLRSVVLADGKKLMNTDPAPQY